MRPSRLLAPLLAVVTATGCAADSADSLAISPDDVTKAGDGKADSSVEAVFVDMEFDGTLLASSAFNPSQTIRSQMLYTIGHLNHDGGVGRLDRLTLTDVTTTTVAGGVEISYHARMPVAWSRQLAIPASYTFSLPRDITFDGLEGFTTKYMARCVDAGAHDVTSGSMWYYYRPHRSGCTVDAADVVELSATVSLSASNTTGKYPEYDKVWEDGVLRVVAIFGKNKDGETTASDPGIAAYNRFVAEVRAELSPLGVTTTPAVIPRNPGVAIPDSTFAATLADGRQVEIVALLVDNVRTPPAWFDARYGALSTRADLIAYNGHAGLGQNVRALAQKGDWTAGQYLMLFMNGCDTYAYVDGSLAQTRASFNPDDPTGTKYMDIVTNGMPAFFHQLSNSTMAFVRGLMAYDAPVTYEMMFVEIDDDQVVLVSGEEDNVFVPGGGGDGEDDWTGLSESGTVVANQEVRYASPLLAPGTYRFSLTGTRDADLYVRVGDEPNRTTFDCRPYKASSNEVCEVELGGDAVIHVMVRGWAASSNFALVGAEVP